MIGIHQDPDKDYNLEAQYLLVMTRWAEDDLTGRLLKAQTEPKADTWRQISFLSDPRLREPSMARILGV